MYAAALTKTISAKLLPIDLVVGQCAMTSTIPKRRTARSTYTQQSQQQQQQQPTQIGRRLSLYERSKQQQLDRERNLKRLEAELMVECTFQPNTKFFKKKSTTSIGESVFERLYRMNTPSSSPSDSNRTTPVMSNVSRRVSPSSQKTSPTTNSTISRSSTNMSSRLEGMYKQGVRKMRTRPINNAEERAVREQRRDEKELGECTFQPNLRWKNEQNGRGKKSKIVMEPNIHRKQVRRKQPLESSRPSTPPPPPLPLEIYVTRQNSWDTPPRDQEDKEYEHNLVSPLSQFPFGYCLSQHHPEPLVRSESITASAGACTEYGSI